MAAPMTAPIVSPPDPFRTRANDVICIKLVNTPGEITTGLTPFHPEFTHQLFNDEFLNGYKNPIVNLFFTGGSMRPFISVTSAEKKVDADNVVEIISSKLSLKPIDTVEAFETAVKEDATSFKPPGTKVASFEAGDQGSFEIYFGTVNDTDCRDFHRKFSIFALFEIDGASPIDEADSRWRFYFLFRKSSQNVYSLAGYSTVYDFFHYPDQIRRRVSQFLLFPPFQKKGLGSKFLKAIYEGSRTKDVYDITVEDPAPDYSGMRDFVDMSLLKEHGYLTDAFKQIVTQRKSALIEEIKNKLKIPEPQIRKCADIYGLSLTNRAITIEYQNFRLAVKLRLFKKFQDVLPEDIRERNKELDTIYRETESGYLRVIQRVFGNKH